MNPPLTTDRKHAESDLPEVQARLEEIVAASGRVQVAQDNLARAQALARDHMADSKVRFLLLRLQEAAGLNEGLSEQWTTLLRECPDDLEIVRYCATRLVKERHVEDALALVERHLPESSDNPARLFARAKLLSDIRAHEQSDALFRRLISQHTDRNMRVEFAKRLRKRGCWRMRSTSSRPSRGTWRPAARRPSWPTRWQATTPSISAWSPNRRWSARTSGSCR